MSSCVSGVDDVGDELDDDLVPLPLRGTLETAGDSALEPEREALTLVETLLAVLEVATGCLADGFLLVQAITLHNCFFLTIACTLMRVPYPHT